MSNFFVFVRKDSVRDFDDIYEGMVPDKILPAKELIEIFRQELSITQWSVSEGVRTVGTNDTSSVEVVLDSVGEKYTRMITVKGIEQEGADKLMSDLGLSELE